MSYRIRPGKPLTREVVRVARIQYAGAIGMLRDQPRGPHEAIHDARKRFKRLRGLFRLVRAAAPEFCARENARVRDIAAGLSTVRDATALVEAMGHLMASDAASSHLPALAAIRDRLAARRDRIASAETDLDTRIAAAIAGCEDGIAALSGLKLPKGKARAVELLARGVARNYGRAVGALEAATASGHAEDWHDLRKHIKYHRMHVQLMSPAWPGDMAMRAEIADLAGEALGDDHDLANLEALITADPDAIGNAAEIATLRTVMAARSAELHAQVRGIVRNLLRDDRKLVQSRIAALWRDAAG
ncbi:MAG: CHAD domain-containing protein [Hoeflea sp.]|nr:CHAD domain-containing protein [Hoeflea sp.]